MTDPTPRASFVDCTQVAWDATSIDAWDTCPRYWYYTIYEGWTHPVRSVHLWFGGIYASCLELYHDLIAAGTEREDAIRQVILHALIATWTHDRDESGERIPDTGHPTTFPEPNKTRENLVRTLVWYFEEYAEEQYRTYTTAEGEAGVEHSFRFPVDNDIIFCGHIDRLCLDPEDNIFVHDQKSTKMALSPRYFDQFKPGHQFSMYTFIGQAVYKAPVKGVIVDAAQIMVGFSRFLRSPILHTTSELNEWYDEAMDLITDAQAKQREQKFPRRPSSCDKYGGCPFRQVCARPKGVRENFLRAEFVKRDDPWDPIQRR